jgi:Xaa-Pro aminopeptidase
MKTAQLLVAASESDANLLYATGFFAPDPFIYFAVAGKKYVVMNDLEIGRAEKTATVDRVLSYSRYVKLLKKQGMKAPTMDDVLRCIFRELRVRAVEVPSNFPIGLAKKLRGLQVKVKPAPFYPERAVKTAGEVANLANGVRLAEEGMRAAINVLKLSRIGRGGFLYWRGDKLTAEHIHGVINATIAGLGGVAAHTIVACGNQAVDCHEAGYGPLKAHQSIVIDIFPRDSKTGYWGDITRTVVRGRASEAIKEMYATVLLAQEVAFRKLRDGVDGKEVHEAIQNLFKRTGYKTGRMGGKMQGFFHGTGHSVGLEIHEGPGLSAVSATMKTGNVVTVEPGLYYWGKGGVRLEDMVVIQKRGNRNLMTFPKVLEI